MENKEEHREYPVGGLDDLNLYFMHYRSFEEARQKWEERKMRINKNNMYFIMVEGVDCTEDIIKRFDALPYLHKVLFTADRHTDIQSAYCIEGSKRSEGQIMDLCLYKCKFSGKRWIDEYDYVSFLNKR